MLRRGHCGAQSCKVIELHKTFQMVIWALDSVPQAALFVDAGISKIRLTGGEPTLRRDIVELTGALSALPGCDAVGITTNGIALQRKLANLKENGVWGMNRQPLLHTARSRLT